ncbi:MAG: hypothetical protein KatS3mg105_2197 [Gemmatales bacterium]|nr:MAG: hypothetical protein KatS3mg105_2197 [Gemmatales bacterium]
MKTRVLLAVALAVAFVGTSSYQAAQESKPKYTIKEVMKIAMKGGLCKKVAGGSASKEEKEQLVALFTALTQNKPPKGDEKAWKKRTEALLKAAKAALEGDAKAGKALQKNANCGSCHKMFKG